MAKFIVSERFMIRGHRGNVVGYCRRGTWCLRTYVAHPYDPRTPAQLGQRARFKAMMQFASAARKAIALGLRRQARRLGLVDNNYFLMLNKRWFTAEGVDYRRLQFSEGSIGVRSGNWRVENRGEGGVFRMRCGGERGSIYVFAYCPAEGRGYLSMPSEGGKVQFALPGEFVGKEVHYYGFRVAPNGVASHTVYIEPQNTETIELPKNTMHIEKPAQTETGEDYCEDTPSLARGKP